MRHVLTLIGSAAVFPLNEVAIARVRVAIGGEGVTTLSPAEAVDIDCTAEPDIAAARAALDGAPLDVIAQPVARRRKRLLIADMDSTIVQGETIDELAAYAGVSEAVAALTRLSMGGEVDFARALRERVAMLRGLGLDALHSTWSRTRLTGGARALVATMRAHGAVTALVSGGFTFFTGRVAALAGFDRHHANVLLDDGAQLTGELMEPILDREAKLATLRSLAAEHGIPLAETLAVGDGANDLGMLGAAGLGVAFRARPAVAALASARIDHTDLRALLFAQGYRASEILDPI